MPLTMIEARTLAAVLGEIKKDRTNRSPKFSYAVVRNLRALASIEDDFKEALKDETIDAVFEKHEHKRTEIILKHAAKDDKGDPLLDGTGNPVSVNEAAANSEYMAFVENEPDLKAAIEKRSARVNELSNQDVPDITLHKVPIDLFPEMSVSFMEAVYPMISE